MSYAKRKTYTRATLKQWIILKAGNLMERTEKVTLTFLAYPEIPKCPTPKRL